MSKSAQRVESVLAFATCALKILTRENAFIKRHCIPSLQKKLLNGFSKYPLIRPSSYKIRQSKATNSEL